MDFHTGAYIEVFHTRDQNHPTAAGYSILEVTSRVNLNLFAAFYCYIVATSSVETTSRRFVFAGNSFSDLLRIQLQSLYPVNNIFLNFNYRSPRDTDIRQCIKKLYTTTQIRLIMHCYLLLSACNIWRGFGPRVYVTP